MLEDIYTIEIDVYIQYIYIERDHFLMWYNLVYNLRTTTVQWNLETRA